MVRSSRSSTIERAAGASLEVTTVRVLIGTRYPPIQTSRSEALRSPTGRPSRSNATALIWSCGPGARRSGTSCSGASARAPAAARSNRATRRVMPHPTSKPPGSRVSRPVVESRRATATAALHFFTRHSVLIMDLRTILLPAFLLVTIGTQASASAQSTSSERSTNALIVGQVIDSSTGNGVGGALVTLSLINDAVALDSSSPRPRTVVSTADGRYIFRDLRAGRYTIGASKPGYIAGGLGPRRPGAPRQLLVLADSQKLNASPISLWRHAALSGLVVDDGGEPVVGAAVRALRRTPPRGREFGGEWSATSDDRGFYRVAQLPARGLSRFWSPIDLCRRFATQPDDVLSVRAGARASLHRHGGGGRRPRRHSISCCQPRPAFASAERSRIQADRAVESQSGCGGRIPTSSRSIWRFQQP